MHEAIADGRARTLPPIRDAGYPLAVMGASASWTMVPEATAPTAAELRAALSALKRVAARTPRPGDLAIIETQPTAQ